MRRRLLRGLGAAALLCAVRGAARADTCGSVPGFEAVLPAPGTNDVPVNPGVAGAVSVRVRYRLGDAPPPDGLRLVADGVDVPGTNVQDEWSRELRFEPFEGSLRPFTRYEASAPAANGEVFTWAFRTGDATDRQPPVMGEIDRIDWAFLGDGADDDPCGPEEGLVRYEVSLEFAPAPDDVVARENVEYLVHRTTGPNADAPLLEAVAGDDGAGRSIEARVYLPNDPEYLRELCFTVGARDLSDNFSGARDEACVTLEEGPFFRSICSVAPGARGSAAGAAVLLVAAAWLARRRNRVVRRSET